MTDTGIGIAEDVQARIFDRSWQAKHSRCGSAGLGLAIAKGIGRAHGGRILLESRPGDGSVFHFTIPLHAPCVVTRESNVSKPDELARKTPIAVKPTPVHGERQ